MKYILICIIAFKWHNKKEEKTHSLVAAAILSNYKRIDAMRILALLLC